METNHLEPQQFAEEMRQQVVSAVHEGADSFMEDEFALIVSDYLAEAGEIDDLNVCSHRQRGMQLNGYSISEDDDVLDLFYVNYTGSIPSESVPASQVKQAFEKLLAFRKAAHEGLHDKLTPTAPAHDVASRLLDIKDAVTQIRLFYLTDGVAKPLKLDDYHEEGVVITYHVWDIVRLYRLASSGRKREPTEIDFVREFGMGVPCLGMAQENDSYSSWLAIIPATTLAGIYERFGPRLLERNVRSFLQARGAVNAGMRKTILNEPDMFLAYNNGLSATADSVDIAQGPNGPVITYLHDLQIVNGAQTTASLFTAWKKDKADLSNIYVQMKLTVIKDREQMDEIVPRISQYSNSQNKIQTADFDANDPYHRTLEELSRTIWAPSATGTMRQTHWFYERARGQYADEKSRAGTRARMKAFEEINPRQHKFTKTDVAKYENTWDQMPHFVSRGAQKNFREFTVRLKERGNVLPDQKYFEHLIAKMILFKSAEKLIQKLELGGYRANTVTYTLALISNKTAQRFDLDKIWRDQAIPEELETLINVTAPQVYDNIVRHAGAANVTEWCKKADAWEKARLVPVDVTSLSPYMSSGAMGGPRTVRNTGIDKPNEDEAEAIKRVAALGGNMWLQIASWAMETNNLQPWQRAIAYSLGNLANKGRQPSRKQAVQGQIILAEAERLGFDILNTPKV